MFLVFEVRGLVEKNKKFPFKVLNEYYTDQGMITDGKFYPRSGGKPEPLARFDVRVTPGGSWGSFLQAVRSRKAEELNAPVEHGHFSAGLCHLANISYRLGTQGPFRDQTKRLGDNREIHETFANLQDNLAGVGVELDRVRCQLGRTLTFNPKAERFTGDGAEQANAYLTREYRAPFVVPEQV